MEKDINYKQAIDNLDLTKYNCIRRVKGKITKCNIENVLPTDSYFYKDTVGGFYRYIIRD